MRQLVICGKDFHEQYKDVISAGSMQLFNETVYFALIEKANINFDSSAMKNYVLVRKMAFSCNYRDMSLINLAHNRIKKLDELSYYSIGSDFSGVIVQTGTDVTRFKVGDRVIGDGSYPNSSDKEAAPGVTTNHASNELEIIHGGKLAIMPDNMIFTDGAAFSVGAQTTFGMIDKLRIQDKDSVLITGIKSNTSLFVINALKQKNVALFGISRNEVDENFFKCLGVTKVFYIENSFKTLMECKELADFVKINGKFNHIIDPFGDSHLFKVLDLIAVGGKYVTCGLTDQVVSTPVSINLNIEMSKIISNNITIMGNCLGSTENLNTALSAYRKNDLKVVIDSVTTDINAFMQRSFLAKNRLGKVIFNYE